MWQTPVYDRTAADVAAGAEKCYITAELLNRIEGNTAHMAQLLGVEIDTRTWTSLGLLTRAQMQRILDNLATVRAAYYTLPGTPNIKSLQSLVRRKFLRRTALRCCAATVRADSTTPAPCH